MTYFDSTSLMVEYANFNCASHVVSSITPHYDEQQMPVAAPISQSTSEESATSSSSSAPAICITGKFSKIECRYHIKPRVLGQGHHGSVKECINRTTGRRFAVKSIRKSDPAVKRNQLACEIKLLKEMKHRGIVQLVDVFEDADYVHLVTDLLEGGELFDKIVEKASNDNSDSVCFAEDEAARIMYQLLTAVSYLHKRNIVHRDIKAENILFESENENSPVKIIDFGLSRKHRSGRQRPMTTAVGTPYYVAPEVLRKRYNKSCDIWSAGVIAYILLCGYPPFNGENDVQTHRSVIRGKYDFPAEEWNGVGSEAVDFINRMLQMNPRKRMTAEQALKHPWIVKHHVTSEMMLEEECHNSSVEVVYHESPRKQHPSQPRGRSRTRKVRMPMYGFTNSHA